MLNPELAHMVSGMPAYVYECTCCYICVSRMCARDQHTARLRAFFLTPCIYIQSPDPSCNHSQHSTHFLQRRK